MCQNRSSGYERMGHMLGGEMAALNRNIVTEVDIRNYLDPDKGIPETLDTNPPAGAAPPAVGAPPAAASPAAGAAPGGLPVSTADDYLTRLVKYIPPEVIGAYLLLAGLIKTNLDGTDQAAELQRWLGSLLIVMIVLTAVYDKVVLGIVRKSQIAMSIVGLIVYVFVAGDWFATMDWYQQWYSTFALVGFGFLVLFVKLPELPTPSK